MAIGAFHHLIVHRSMFQIRILVSNHFFIEACSSRPIIILKLKIEH